MLKFFDLSNLSYFWEKIKETFVMKEAGKGLSTNDFTNAEKSKLAGIEDGANNFVLEEATAETLGGVKIGANVNVTEDGTISVADATTDAKGLVQLSDAVDSDSTTVASTANAVKKVHDIAKTAIQTAEKGVAGGVVPLNESGLIDSNYLPSYVDDVIEGTFVSETVFNNLEGQPIVGETGKIYVDTTTNKTYRWGGTTYVIISETIALGTTSSTAFRGDYGQIAYEHSLKTEGNPHNVTKADIGLDKVENKTSTEILDELTKEKVNGLIGYVPASKEVATAIADGLMASADKVKLDAVEAGAQVNVLEAVKVNGVALEVSDKGVNINMASYFTAFTPEDIDSICK